MKDLIPRRTTARCAAPSPPWAISKAWTAAAAPPPPPVAAPAAPLPFEPHPRAFFRPDEPLFRLTDEAAKLRLFAATALDGAIVMKFDAALAALDPAAFIQRV